jgi:hypothetical protein
VNGRPRWLEDGGLVVLLLVICVALFRDVLFDSDALVAFDDIVRQFYPWRLFALVTPQPFWLPFPSTGEPVLPNVQIGLFYPIDRALEAVVPLHRALSFGLVLHLWLMGVSTYALTRELTGNRAGAFLAACTLMLSQHVIAHMHGGHYSLVTAAAWMPLIFLFGKRAVDRSEVKSALFLAVVVGLQVLAGHPQITFLTLSLVTVYGLAALLRRGLRDRHWRTAIRDGLLLAISLALGVALAAIQLIPVLEFNEMSTRTGGLNFGSSSLYSLPFHGLSGLVAPFLLGNPLTDSYLISGPYWEFALAVGLLPLTLVFALILVRRLDFMTWFLAGTAMVAVVMALGAHTPVYRLAWRFVPGISSFRVPARFGMLLTFALALLAAYGFSALAVSLSEPARQRVRRLSAVLIGVAIPAAAAGLVAMLAQQRLLAWAGDLLSRSGPGQEPVEWYLERLPNALSSAVEEVLWFALFAAAAGLLFRWRAASEDPPRWFAPAACAIAVLNLAIYAQPMVRAEPVQEVYGLTSLEKFLVENASGYRVYDRANVHIPGAETVHGIRMLEGYNPMRLQAVYQVLRTIRDSPLERSQGVLNVLAARYVISDRALDLPWLVEVYSDSSSFVYENRTVLPRAFVVESGDRDLSLLGAEREQAGRGASDRGVRITAESPNEFTIEADVGAPATLVLSEVAYPGWRVYVDEEARPLQVAYEVLRGVEIGAGRHTVRFVYEPASMESGRRITFGAGIILAIALALSLVRRRRMS